MSNDNSALTAYEPQSLEQAIKVSEMLSKSGLVPRALQGKPTDILLVMWKGRELGLSTIQSLGSIDIIEGKAVMSAELQVAMCTRSPLCEYFTLVESTDARAIYETKRRGAPRPVVMSWLIEQAQKAGLMGKDNWRKHPAAMLRWRASSALAKTVYPELVLGIYTPDEADEIRSGTTPVPPPPPAEKEVNAAPVEPPPEPPPKNGKKSTRTEQLKKQLQVVDVQPGESEQQATERQNAQAEWNMSMGERQSGNGKRDPILQARGARLWSIVQAAGWDVIRFKGWCVRAGVDKSAKEMTAEDLDTLEERWAIEQEPPLINGQGARP